jgi:hypothetical protein
LIELKHYDSLSTLMPPSIGQESSACRTRRPKVFFGQQFEGFHKDRLDLEGEGELDDGSLLM